MSLQDSLFAEQVEYDVTLFAKNTTHKRVIIFPPVNNYRRFLIHSIVQDNFKDLSTFSIGQGYDRRTVVCFKSDLIRDFKLNGVQSSNKTESRTCNSNMGVEGPLTSIENSKQKPVKSAPAVEIYRPPAARRLQTPTTSSETSSQAKTKQRRPDRAVYVPKQRRSVDGDMTSQNESPAQTKNNSRRSKTSVDPQSLESSDEGSRNSADVEIKNNANAETRDIIYEQVADSVASNTDDLEDVEKVQVEVESVVNSNGVEGHFKSDECSEHSTDVYVDKLNVKSDLDNQECVSKTRNLVSDVLIISTCDTQSAIVNKNEDVKEENNILSNVSPLRSPEKKPKKVARAKSKPASPPSPPVKINRDECDWDSLFDDNGECLDPTLIEELTAAVGEVTIEQPKNDYKAFSRPVEVSNDEFGHVIEIYNFPSDFKTSDLATVFSPFKNGGFELKWVDDTHCLGVFSSPLVAAEVLASDHAFVKTRPLSEATALSRTKARKSAEFLQPYRSRPETCAALARRLVTGALGVRLATARQEREHEKVVLREAKERRRLANKQREDAWEGIIAQK
ncbi:R3H and coiled-coil domain-containing protein 1 [Microplitis demolitor]|uniref:R3H and coiled-coil domain-containing protein 1 n=1 Tax=Microplitis demolitor TaxID=69319 RepID=UPI0004CD6E7C|nr:R3H and coiled-coil domain-containing protein 1 [Microplitis demolitor]